MARGQKLSAPTQFTFGDKLRLATGVLILLLGIVILWRTLSFGVLPQAMVVSGAFIAFGVYRLWLGYTRLKAWQAGK